MIVIGDHKKGGRLFLGYVAAQLTDLWIDRSKEISSVFTVAVKSD